MRNVNTDKDNFISMLHSYNLKTNEWNIPKTNGIEPERRREINGVVNYETGKFYIFGGSNGTTKNPNTIRFNDMNIFDAVSLTWSKGSDTINAPLPRLDYTATLLSNGIIVFIGGREEINKSLRDVDMNH
jgi:N-acetylneuraminic acid mutarotase